MSRFLFVNSGTFTALDRLTLWMNGFMHQDGVLAVHDWHIIYDRPPAGGHLQHRCILLLEVTDAFAGAYIQRLSAELAITR